MISGVEEEHREVVEDLKQEAIMDHELAGIVLVEEEQRAPIPRDCCVKAKVSLTKPFRMDTIYDEEKEDSNPMQEQDESQIVGVGRHVGGWISSGSTRA